MHKAVPIMLVLCCASAQAVAQNAEETARAIVGNWEISNADREKSCNLALKADPVKGGRKIEFEKNCAAVFPATRDVTAWSIVKGDLRLLNARGRAVFDFTEVESGMYEAERGAEGLYFLQSHDTAPAPARTAADIFGDWMIARAGKGVCAVTLTGIGAGGETGYALKVQQDCDSAAIGLQPVNWRMDRGELVLSAANGQSLRFEESEPGQWRRVPDNAGGLTIGRK